MNVEIISIGFELLSGRTVNTNASYIARKATAAGFRVRWITTIPDEQDSIREAIHMALSRADVVISTGGLGPTNDDITKKVIADYFESDMMVDTGILDKVKQRFVARGLTMPEINREQALIPKKAEILNNEVGTAPGLLFRKEDKMLFVLPGVPAEMKDLIDKQVMPRLGQSQKKESRVLSFKTCGITESALYEKINPILEQFNHIDSMYYPDYSGVELKIVVKGDKEGAIQKVRSSVLNILGHYVISENPEDSLISVLARYLSAKKQTIAVAESCTGGLLGELLTSLSGSSEYFMGGMITYSNNAKIKLLGVPHHIIEEYGAVSEQTAAQMAQLVRDKFNTTWGIGITGIAGPTGGTEEKPVGLVYIGLSGHEKTEVKRYVFGYNRDVNRLRAAYSAMALLLRNIR